ncbi:AI-2E family transporter [archaeon]|jgi:predicted PurR-regulated permease PerM|nr:AI-2E family transporter [archaeon]
MLNKENVKDLLIYILLLGLFLLAIVIIKPIIGAIIYGILLAYIFHPIYKIILSKLKSKNLSASIVCLGVLAIVIGLIIIIISSLFKEIISLYLMFQQTDLINIIKEALPPFIASSEISSTFVSAINNSLLNLLSLYLSKISKLLLNIPAIILQLFVVFLIFFFALKDGTKALGYIKSISPLKKETHEKFFKYLRDITKSVLLGQILSGLLQGVFAGIGYFIFGVPNALLLTLLTIIMAIIPIIGPWFIWVPVVVYLYATGRNIAATGLFIYGLVIVSWIDNFVRPVIVSKRTKVNTAIVIIGMIGGLFAFGILGLIIGPLILAYILLAIELYRKNTLDKDSIIFEKEK